MRRLVGLMAAVLLAGGALMHGTVAGAQTATIKVTSPANGATVAAPASITVAIAGVTVKPASAGDPDAYHYHIFVDVDPATVVQPGQPIPTGQANIIHTADATVPVSDLAPGAHTITVVLTKTNHVPLSPTVQDRVQLTVAAAGQAQPSTAAGVAAPRTGTGAAGESPVRAPIAVLLLVSAFTAGALLIRRRRAA